MKKDRLAFLAVGVLLGVLLVSPVGAHVTDSLDHLWNGDGHIKDKVSALGDGRWAADNHNHNKTYLRFSPDGYLPAGKTLTGVVSGAGLDQYALFSEISFQVPINFVPQVVIVDDSDPDGCPGTANNPKADPGYLCIYTGFSSNVPGDYWYGWHDPSDGGGDCEGDGCRTGISVYAYVESATGYSEIFGTWAVKAPTA